ASRSRRGSAVTRQRTSICPERRRSTPEIVGLGPPAGSSGRAGTTVFAMDDHPLVLALAAGDARGLAGAYREYGDRLYTYCRGMLGDQDAAADAVHATFVVACQRIGQRREPDRLRSWLYAIARNECLRQLRGQSRRVSLAEAGEGTAAEPAPAGGMRA